MPKSAAPQPESRERILRATIELISEVGADRVRTRAVAERAGVNVGLVHYHFGSMTALLSAAVDAAVAEESQPLVDALTAETGARDALERMFGHLRGLGRPTPGLLVAMDLMVRATRDPAARSSVRRMLRDFRTALRARLEMARRTGELAPGVDPEAAATLLAALFDGLGMHRLIDRGVDPVEAAAALLDALFGPVDPGTGNDAGPGEGPT